MYAVVHNCLIMRAARHLGFLRSRVLRLGPRRSGVGIEAAVWALRLAPRDMDVKRKAHAILRLGSVRLTRSAHASSTAWDHPILHPLGPPCSSCTRPPFAGRPQYSR